ncbi:MAG: hypothetical protein H0Z28_05670 [Archaeoglobus sp.]|nr:hypothetical protein [Archaeoglobus sp.]
MLVNGYEFGRIIVDGRKFTSDIILATDNILNSSWWRKEGHRVSKEDIKEILDYSPEIVIFGTGYYGVVKVEKDVEDLFKSKGARVEKLKSSEAVKRFNELSKEGKRVVLAIHLTC